MRRSDGHCRNEQVWYYIINQGCTKILGAKSPGRLNYVRATLIFLGPQLRQYFGAQHFEMSARFLENFWRPLIILDSKPRSTFGDH